MSRLRRRPQPVALAAVLAGAGLLAGTFSWLGGAGADDAVPGAVVEHDPAVSGDGRRVAYVAPSTDGSPQSVWLLDRSSGARTELTPRTDGVRPGRSVHPVVSDDGCSIVVVTELALDLFRDDDRGDRWDVYRTVVPECPGGFEPGEWELVSSVGEGAASASDMVEPDDRPSVDASGNIVAYTRRPGTPDDPIRPEWRVVEIADLTVPLGEPGRVTSAPAIPEAAPNLAATYVGQRQPVLSATGRQLAFTTDIEVTVAETETAAVFTGVWTARVLDGAAVTQVVRWDRAPGSDDDGELLRVVSVLPDGTPATTSSSQPTIDADGDTIAFASAAPGLVSTSAGGVAPTGGVAQIYRATISETVELRLVSAGPDGPADRATAHPSIDASGRLVAFESLATNLSNPSPAFVADPSGADLLLADVESGAMRRITTDLTGSALPYGARAPRLSSTGRTVVFETVTPDSFATESFAAPAGAGSAVSEPPHQAVSAPGDVAEDPWRIAVSVAPVELSISDLDLGTAPVGGSSQEWFTTVVNRGLGAFVPATIMTTSPEFSVTGGSCRPTVPVLGGESCTVEVTFSPSIDGPIESELIIAERGFGAEQLRAGLRAVGGTPNVVGLPSSVDFGDGIVLLASAPETITFANNGIAETGVDSLALGGTHPADFTVVADGCSGRLLSVGETCTVQVAFAPLDSGPRSATITAHATSGATSGVVLVGGGGYLPLAAAERYSVEAPGRVDVVGLGFPVDSFVTVGWVGEQRTSLVLTDHRGELRARLEVPRALGGGRHQLVVIDAVGRFEPVLTPEVLVTANGGSGGASPAHRAGR